MTFRNDLGPLALQRNQALCRYHGISVPSDVRAVQVLVKGALVTLGSSRDRAELLVEHKKICEASRSSLEASLTASDRKLSDGQKCMQALLLTKETIEKLATKVDKSEKALAA